MTGARQRTALLLAPGAGGAGAATAADADVAAVAALLTGRCGYAPDEIEVLTGPAADRAGILSALERLRDGCAPQGQVVLYFTGHGACFADPADAWGEQAALEPYGASSREDLIADDELLAWLHALWETTSDVHLLLDSCFSGGVDGDDLAAAALPDGRPYAGGSGWPADTRYALLASSRYSLTSATATFPELGGRQHSLLTGCLVTLLQEWTGPPPTYAELRTLLDAATAARGTAQQPQACGDVHRQVLSGVRRPSRRLVPLSGPTSLGAGAVHGVVAGSRWAAFPRGPELEVVDVAALRSTCRPLGTAEVGRAAVVGEVSRPGDGGLRVVLRHAAWLSGPPAASLVDDVARRLAASPLLGVDAEQPLAPFADELSGADVVLACSDAYLTAVCDGLLVTRLHDAGSEGALELLVQDLEEIARWRTAHDALVSAPGGVRLDLLRRPVAGGAFEDVGDDALLAPGDALAVRVTNSGDRRLWPSVFHLGMDCTVVRLFPRTPQNRPLEPGQTRSWGLSGAAGWTVERVAHGNDLRWPAPRRQSVGVWATGAEADLGVLEAGPAVARAAGVAPVHEAPAVATTLARAPAPADAPVPASGGWAAAVRHYLVGT